MYFIYNYNYPLCYHTTPQARIVPTTVAYLALKKIRKDGRIIIDFMPEKIEIVPGAKKKRCDYPLYALL